MATGAADDHVSDLALSSLIKVSLFRPDFSIFKPNIIYFVTAFVSLDQGNTFNTLKNIWLICISYLLRLDWKLIKFRALIGFMSGPEFILGCYGYRY